MTTTPRIPHESIELVPITVTLDGTAITSGIELAVTVDPQRPSTWAAATTVDTSVGYLLDGTLDAGIYRLWARYTSSPETPVVDCGLFQLT